MQYLYNKNHVPIQNWDLQLILLPLENNFQKELTKLMKSTKKIYRHKFVMIWLWIQKTHGTMDHIISMGRVWSLLGYANVHWVLEISRVTWAYHSRRLLYDIMCVVSSIIRVLSSTICVLSFINSVCCHQ